jgi:hypothetical protein
VPEPCPTCHAPFLVEKRLKAGLTLQRASEGCKYKWVVETPAPSPAIKNGQ